MPDHDAKSAHVAPSKSARRRAHRRDTVARSHRIHRAVLGAAVVLLAAVSIGVWEWNPQAPLSTLGTLVVHKSPTCACCARWVTRAWEHGFAAIVQEESDVRALKQARGIPATLHSCHTTVVDSYVFEGHVPLDLVERVLRERPAIAGLAVAGMPQGAPGMEMGAEHYEIMAFTRTGETSLYARR